MGAREERRAAARAGRVCPCGEPIDDARRLTTRFCSVRCRMKAHRAKGIPSRKNGLRRGQVRILEVLSKVKGGMTRSAIAEKTRITGRLGITGQLSDLLGHVDPDRRGSETLLCLRHVEEVRVAVEEGMRAERLYRITDAGREALEEHRRQGLGSAPGE